MAGWFKSSPWSNRFERRPFSPRWSRSRYWAGTVREAMGYGRQKNRLHQYLGSEYNSSFVPKVELTVFVEQEHVQAAIKAIVGQARTGRIGDGKDPGDPLSRRVSELVSRADARSIQFILISVVY